MENREVEIEYEKVMEGKTEKLIGAVYEQCKSKSIIEYNKCELGKIRRERPLKIILITCNMTPEYTYEEAWKIMIEERDKIAKELIEKYKEIRFAVTTIEHHHTISDKMRGRMKVKGKDKKVKGKEDKEDDKEEENKEKCEEESMMWVMTRNTRREYEEKIREWKEEKKIWGDMTEEEKIVGYYNYMQTMKYMNKQSEREETFKEWIEEETERMRKEMDMRGKEKMIWEERERGIISKYREIGNNLLGYPHIHIAIAYGGITNAENFRREIYEYLMKKKVFGDAQVDETKTKQAEEMGAGITYVLKNSANKYVTKKIEKYGKKGEIIRWYINNTGEEEVEEYMKYIGGFIKKEGRKYYRPIGGEVMVRREQIKKEEEIKMDSEKNNYNRTLGHIIETMKINEIVICEGEIYKKKKGTRRTYEYYGTIKEFVMEVTKIEPYNIIGIKWKNEMIERMEMQSKMEDKEKLKMGGSEGNYVMEFPSIKMDYRMIEFKDFYFNTITTEIYKEQDKYNCHYYANIELENLEKKIERFQERSEWMEIIRRNGLNERMVCVILFTLLRPKQFKGPTPLLYGESDAGKSTLITAFRNFYPKSKVSTFLKTLSEYHVAELLNDKKIAIMEEANQILNDKGSRSQLLAVMEGSTVVANKKHGEIKNIKQNANTLAICNVLETDEYTKDEAIMNRVYPIGNMRTIKEKRNVQEEIKKEEPYIYLYTALQFMRMGKGEEGIFFKINERMTEDMKRDIEEAKEYYEGIYTERQDVDIYSDEYIKQNKEMRKEDDKRMIKYNVERERAVGILKNTMDDMQNRYKIYTQM